MRTGYETIEVEVKNGVAIFTMNNPPVNQLSERFVRELENAINEAFLDQAIKAIILTGKGKNFIAGADITELKGVKNKDTLLPKVMENHRFLNGIEAGPKPVIAAINGNCLGGGLELAMACHRRVAVKGVKVGLVEVQLGLIPGGGGTQRLPRLIGIAAAAEMITSGQAIPAENAESRGLIDEVVAPGHLLNQARKMAGQFMSGKLNLEINRTASRFDRLPSAAEKTAIISYAKKTIAEKTKGYLAPFKAIESFDRGLSYDFQADLAVEADLFCQCVISDVAKNLIGIFFNTRAAGRLPRIKGLEPKGIKKVGVLGSGAMGSGIVNLLLREGFHTVIWDINDETIKKGIAAIRKTFAYPIKKKKMTEADLDLLIQEKLKATVSLEDLKDVDLVVEAVLEDMKIKQDIWKRLQSICREKVIFGTNTSALPITEMASVLSNPGRMIGLHFFNPAERMMLLEIICGKETSDENLATSVAFGRAINKVPIVVNDGPGFYVSRQLGGLMNGFTVLVAEGVNPMFIEKAIVNFGMPMGPATLYDLTGIDIAYHVGKTFERTLGERYKVHPLMEQIYQTGCYGRKTGAGWFDYSKEQPVLNPKVMHILDRYLKEKGINHNEVSEQEVVDVMLADAINDAAYMIQGGICDRPQDMDLAMIYGTGFPPYRGGILRYADSWGIKNVYKKLLELEKHKGARFRPADLIKEMAKTGKSFYQD